MNKRGKRMDKLRSRQVHLDFHTSEFIKDIGENFSKENFQNALKKGYVNSITVFAKCHHGWCYYPSNVGEIHPGLSFDLLGEMIDAAHEIDVKVPVYITVGWSANDAENHPEWVSRNKDGSLSLMNYDNNAKSDDSKPIVSWKNLCPAGDYKNHIYSLTEEICERYPNLDGLFYDICFLGEPCYCEYCLSGMIAIGLNPEEENDAKKYYKIKRREFILKCTSILKKAYKDGSIFFNGAATTYNSSYHDLMTHFEIEDLPTTWGGYDKMPINTKYFARSGKDYLGMTGKFHTMWGEFGGFKNPEALKYECAAMVSFGARCSIGDQLHPSGEMDMETYRTIGHAYKYIEEIEEYCFDTIETAQLGIILSENPKSNEGLVKMLLEKQVDFDVIHPDDDFSIFQAIILPDCVRVDVKTGERLSLFVKNGGSLLLTGTSGLLKEQDEFFMDIGVEYIGKSVYDNDYVVLGDEISSGIVKSPFLFYQGANIVNVIDAKVIAKIKEPYFNRTYGKYCSHQNTPNKLEDAFYPAAIRKGNIVYLSHNLCEMYFTYGAQYHRDYLINAFKLIYKDPVMHLELPSAGRARLAKQNEKNRYVMHLLYASPIKRGIALVVDDIVEIRGIDVLLKIEEPVKNVAIFPENRKIDFEQKNGKLKFQVETFKCHCIIVIDY